MHDDILQVCHPRYYCTIWVLHEYNLLIYNLSIKSIKLVKCKRVVE